MGHAALGYHGRIMNRRISIDTAESAQAAAPARGSRLAAAPPVSVRRLMLSALLAVLVGCASVPPIDETTPPPEPDSSAEAAANPPAATLTPAERQARAKQAATQADQAAQQAMQQQCSDLRAQIRTQQLAGRQAPSTSISGPIVQARQAHADQRIQALQERYDSLGCASSAGPPARAPLVPVTPAPNGLSPPGAQGAPGAP